MRFIKEKTSIRRISSRKKGIIFFGSFLVALVSSLVLISSTFGAGNTCTWTGAVDQNWSTAGNWNNCGGTIPSGDAVVFNGTVSNVSSTINQAFSVTSVTINNGYTGTITQSGNLTITGAYSQTSTSSTFQDTTATPYSFSVGGSFGITYGANFDRYTGSGTPGDPFMVRDVYDLQAMGANATSLTKSYKLNNDIAAGVTQTNSWNSGAGFVPVGTAGVGYTGNFYGDGYQVQGLYINRNTTDYVGLFGQVGVDGNTNGSISDVGVTSVNITGDRYVGGLAGYFYTTSAITNSYTTGIVNATDYVGGFAGYNDGSSISDCYSTAAVAAATGSAGGFVGTSWAWHGNSTISNCYATGNVTGSATADVIGGLSGSAGATGGYSSSITDSYATGSATGDDKVGGFVGAGGYFGGPSTITNSYSSGTVTGNTNVGGFMGVNDTNRSTQTNSFWLKYTGHNDSLNGVGNGSGTGVTNKNYLEMVGEATYTGWDFDTDWWINEEAGLPFLRHQGYVWTGSASSAWTNRLNWNKKRGYPGDGGDGADKWVFINTGSASIATPGSTTTLGGLQLGTGYSGTLTLGAALILNYEGNNNGLLEINAGTFSQSTFTLVAGNINMTGGVFNGNSGTTTIEGNVVVTGSGTKLNTTSGTMSVINMDISSSGEVEMGANGTLTISGSGTPLTGSGTLDAVTNTPNTIEYTGNGTTNITAAGPVTTYSNLKFKPKGFEREDAITLDAVTGGQGINGEVIDTENGYAYFPNYVLLGSGNIPTITKVRLSDFKQVGVLALAAGDEALNAGILDSANGKMYFGTATAPGRVIKVDIATFSREDSLDFPAGSGEDQISCAGVLDPINGKLYFGVFGTPNAGKGHKIVRVDTATFTRDGAMEPDDANYRDPHSAVIDPANGYAYFDYTGPADGAISYAAKIDLTNFDYAHTNFITIPTGYAVHAIALDLANQYMYFASWNYNNNDVNDPERVYQINIDPDETFAVETTLAMSTGESDIQSGVFDSVNKVAYFMTATSPVKVIKIDCSDPAAISRVGSITLATGENNVNASVIDSDKGLLYVATWTNPPKIVKINLGNYNMKLGTAVSQTLDVNGNLEIGDGTNRANVTTVDNNPVVDVGGNLTVKASGILTAPSTINVGGNWDSSAGTFTPGTGTVNLTGTGSLKTPGVLYNTYFHDLSLAESTKTTTLLSNAGTTGTLTLSGGSLTGSYSFSMAPDVSGDTAATATSPSSVNISYFLFLARNLSAGENMVIGPGNFGIEDLYIWHDTVANITFKLGGNVTTTGKLITVAYNQTGGVFDTQNYSLNALGIEVGSSFADEPFTLNFGSSNVDIGTFGLYVANNGGSHTLNLNSSNVGCSGKWKILDGTGSITQNPGSSTVSFEGSAAQEITGAITWNNLNVINTNASPDDTNDVDPTNVQTVTGTLQVMDGQWTPYTGDTYANVAIWSDGIVKPDTSAAITVSGNWSNSGTFTHNDGNVTFDGASAQTITGSNTWNNLTIANTHGTPNDTNDVDPSAIQTIAGTLDITDGQWSSYTGDDYANVTIGADGILKPDASASIIVSGNWANSGTFTQNSGTVTFDGVDQQTITTGGQSFNNVVINNTGDLGGTDDDITISGNLDIDGSLTLTDGNLELSTNNPNVNVAGNVSISASGYVTKGTGTWTFDGTTATTYNDVNAVGQNIGDVVIAKTDGDPLNNKVTLAVASGNKMFVDTLTVSADNTLDLNDLDYDLQLLNDGATATVLTVNGTLDTGTSTVTYGATNSGGNVNIARVPYSSLALTGNTETYDLTGDMTDSFKITGSMYIGTLSDSHLDATVNSYDFELEGNLIIYNGSFDTRSNTVTLSDAGETTSIMNGNIAPPSYALTFNNLSVVAGKTVRFETGKYFQVNGELALNGSSGSNVTINSTDGSGQWYINHQGTESANYVTLANSGCVSGSTNISVYNSTNSGNNGSCWVFVSPETPPPSAGDGNTGGSSSRRTAYDPYGYDAAEDSEEKISETPVTTSEDEDSPKTDTGKKSQKPTETKQKSSPEGLNGKVILLLVGGAVVLLGIIFTIYILVRRRRGNWVTG